MRRTTCSSRPCCCSLFLPQARARSPLVPRYHNSLLASSTAVLLTLARCSICGRCAAGEPATPAGSANVNLASIGDHETTGSVGPIDLGSGRTATAITAGRDHTYALLDNGRVRCWGFGGTGRRLRQQGQHRAWWGSDSSDTE